MGAVISPAETRPQASRQNIVKSCGNGCLVSNFHARPRAPPSASVLAASPSRCFTLSRCLKSLKPHRIHGAPDHPPPVYLFFCKQQAEQAQGGQRHRRNLLHAVTSSLSNTPQNNKPKKAHTMVHKSCLLLFVARLCRAFSLLALLVLLALLHVPGRIGTAPGEPPRGAAHAEARGRRARRSPL